MVPERPRLARVRRRPDQPKPKPLAKAGAQEGTQGIYTRVPLGVPLTNCAAPLHLHTLHRTAAARAKHTRSYVAFFPTKRQIPPGRGPVNRSFFLLLACEGEVYEGTGACESDQGR